MLMVRSFDRLDRGVRHVANALGGVGCGNEKERKILRSSIDTGLDRTRPQCKKFGRRKIPAMVEVAIQTHLTAGYGILEVGVIVGVGSAREQRETRELVVQQAA